jgi:hypothetical protein
MQADFEAARLLTMQAAWMADNGKPNSLLASMAKTKAGRTGTDALHGQACRSEPGRSGALGVVRARTRRGGRHQHDREPRPIGLAVPAPGVPVPLSYSGDPTTPADFVWNTATPSAVTPGLTTGTGGFFVA